MSSAARWLLGLRASKGIEAARSPHREGRHLAHNRLILLAGKIQPLPCTSRLAKGAHDRPESRSRCGADKTVRLTYTLTEVIDPVSKRNRLRLAPFTPSSSCTLLHRHLTMTCACDERVLLRLHAKEPPPPRAEAHRPLAGDW